MPGEVSIWSGPFPRGPGNLRLERPRAGHAVGAWVSRAVCSSRKTRGGSSGHGTLVLSQGDLDLIISPYPTRSNKSGLSKALLFPCIFGGLLAFHVVSIKILLGPFGTVRCDALTYGGNRLLLPMSVSQTPPGAEAAWGRRAAASPPTPRRCPAWGEAGPQGSSRTAKKGALTALGSSTEANRTRRAAAHASPQTSRCQLQNSSI